jgi:flavin-dependent dehydrogenase
MLGVSKLQLRDSATDYDAIIAGAGPAGASAAIGLAQRGARVLLLEQKRFPRHKLCGEFISPECLEHFARLGVLAEMQAAGGAALRETTFYGRGGRGVSVPSEWFGGGPGAALGLSRAEMDARLLQRAREVGVEVWEEATVAGLVREADGRVLGAQVRTRAGVRAARAGVTLDATGRARALARKVEKQADQRRAPLVAFKAHLAGARGAENACEIYFYRGGYGGLSSVEGGLSNLCFIVAAADAKDAERALREIVMTNRRAAETLRAARAATGWLAVALERFGRFEPAPAAGLLTVGDAAAFIDPFTGSGMLMALESGALATETVAAHSSNWENLAAAYRAGQREKFARRLRVCAWLRRAAFAPGLAEAALRLTGASDFLRLRLAQATRG